MRGLADRDEMQAYLDGLAAEFLGQGLAPGEMRARARREFGGLSTLATTFAVLASRARRPDDLRLATAMLMLVAAAAAWVPARRAAHRSAACVEGGLRAR